jgi:hypothetical protein
LSGELDASDTMARVALEVAAAVGANVTVKVTLWPEFRIVGRVRSAEKPALETAVCEMVTGNPPVFVRVSDKLALLPT